jgi:hypothetical protein
MTELEALEQVKELLGSFRRGELVDTAIYARKMANVLMSYPRDIALLVCDPLRGLPATQDWIPSIAQLKSALDSKVAELERIRRYLNWGKKSEVLELTKEEPRPTMQQLVEKYGPNWGIKSDNDGLRDPSPGMSKNELRDHYSKYQLAKRKRDET